MATQAARHSRFVGALFLHFDMWVNVWRLHLSLPFGSVWMPQNGVARATRTTYSDPRCFAVRETSRRRRAAGSLVDYNHSLGRYPWHMGSMPACVAAVKKLGETRTILLSTHLFQEVEAMAGRVMLVNDGKLAFDGTPADFKAKGAGQMDQAFHALTTEN